MEESKPENQEANRSEKKRKLKEVCPFGNYKHYYGYRVGQDIENDPRFSVFKKEWFEGKDCLDIGCNNGMITINIAKKFHCRTILGIDIDHDRIEDAKWNLTHFVKQKERMGHAGASKVKGELECSENKPVIEDQAENLLHGSAKEQSILDIVSFRTGNVVRGWIPLPLEYYDTIVCLSVTKWIQLNWGDEGLIRLFAKIWGLLHPGGLLILEPQPWKSYCSKRLVTETTAANFGRIMLYPKYFQEILLDKIGFRTVESAVSGVQSTKGGFNRPVLVFRK